MISYENGRDLNNKKITDPRGIERFLWELFNKK